MSSNIITMVFSFLGVNDLLALLLRHLSLVELVLATLDEVSVTASALAWTRSNKSQKASLEELVVHFTCKGVALVTGCKLAGNVVALLHGSGVLTFFLAAKKW